MKKYVVHIVLSILAISINILAVGNCLIMEPDSTINKQYKDYNYQEVVNIYRTVAMEGTFEDLSAITLKNIGNSYYALREYDTARHLYLKAIPKAGTDYLKYILSSNLGLVNSKLKDFSSSEYWYKQASKYPEFLDEDFYLKYGNYFLHTKNYDSSIYYLNKSITLIEAEYGQSSIKIINPLLNLTHIYYNRSEFEKAKLLINKCLTIVRNNNSTCKQKYDSYYRLGVLNLQKKEYQQVVKIFIEALNLMDSCELKERKTYIYSNIGMAYFYMKKYDSAGYFLNRSLSLLKGRYAVNDISTIQNYGIYLLKSKEDYDSSLFYYKLAASILKKEYGEKHIKLKNIYVCLGDVYGRKGKADSALFYYQKAIELTNPNAFASNDSLCSVSLNGNMPDASTLDILLRRAKLLNKLLEPEYDQALSFKLMANIEYYIEGFKGVLQQKLLLDDQLTSLQTDLRRITDIGMNTAFQAYSLTKDSIFLEKGIYYSEAAKTLVIRSNFSNLADRQVFPGQILSTKYDIKKEANKAYFDRDNDLKNIDKQDSISNRLVSLSLRYDSLLLLTKKYQDSGNVYKRNYLYDIKNVIPEKSMLLSYYLQNESLDIFAITKGSLIWRRQKVDSSFVSLVGNVKNITMLESIFDKSIVDKYHSSAHKLYDVLIPPEVINDDINRIIIVPDDVLNMLPFEILLTGVVDSCRNYRSLPYLIKDYNISYRFAISNENHSKNTGNGKLLTIAPKFQNGKNYTLITEAGSEAESLVQTYEGDKLIPPAGFDKVFAGRLKDYGIIHFATHSIVEDNEPLNSRLVLSDSDAVEKPFLKASDICNMDINADLVVLNGCETGKGELLKGEGVISLAWAFAYAGCPSISMSLNKLDDKSARSIIETYYQGLAQGLSKDKALRRAKLDYLQNCKPSKSHPAFWSGMVSIGDQDPITLQNKSGRLIYRVSIMLGGVLILASILFLRQRKSLQ